MQLSQHSGFRQGAGEFGDQCHASAGHLHARDGARSWRLQSAHDAGQKLRSRSGDEASGSSRGIQPVELEELQQSPDKHEQRGLRPDYRGRARAGVSVRGQVDVLKVKSGAAKLILPRCRSVGPVYRSMIEAPAAKRVGTADEVAAAAAYLCGDDESAKIIAATLITDVGFEPVDAGP